MALFRTLILARFRRAPKSLLNGLMWFDPDSHDTLNKRKVRAQLLGAVWVDKV